VQSSAERAGIIEALIFVSEEPISAKTIAELLREERSVIDEALAELSKEFNGRNGGLQLREVAGGWQFATRPEYHEHVRAFLRSRPSAKLSIASLETLAVIALQTTGHGAGDPRDRESNLPLRSRRYSTRS